MLGRCEGALEACVDDARFGIADSKSPPRARRHGKNKWRDRTGFVRSNLDMEHTIRESHGGARGQVSLGLTLTVVLAVACLANALCLYAYI